MISVGRAHGDWYAAAPPLVDVDDIDPPTSAVKPEPHVKAMGHTFNDEMRCHNCGREYATQQEQPEKCTKRPHKEYLCELQRASI